MKKISIVMPVYNEEEIIETNYEIVSSVDINYELEIVYSNDGSNDNTLNLLEKIASNDNRVKVVSLSRNFGAQNAIMAGLKYATGDAIVIMDADLQDPIEVVPQMVELWEKGNDVVYGKRVKREGETVFKLLTANMYYRLLNKLSDTEFPRNTGDFRLVDRKIIDVINSLPEHNKYMRGLFSWCGFNQTPIEYIRKPRLDGGKSKYSMKKMIKLAKDGIFSFSSKPIGIVGKLGLFSILLSIILLIYALVSPHFFNESIAIEGWLLIICAIAFFSGIQLVALWIVAEYIQRIYEETKNRPNYIIDKKINIE